MSTRDALASSGSLGDAVSGSAAARHIPAALLAVAWESAGGGADEATPGSTSVLNDGVFSGAALQSEELAVPLQGCACVTACGAGNCWPPKETSSYAAGAAEHALTKEVKSSAYICVAGNSSSRPQTSPAATSEVSVAAAASGAASVVNGLGRGLGRGGGGMVEATTAATGALPANSARPGASAAEACESGVSVAASAAPSRGCEESRWQYHCEAGKPSASSWRPPNNGERAASGASPPCSRHASWGTVSYIWVDNTSNSCAAA
mmetsp:Transcript_97993/g.282661  ORF Transcript_97993/g.282661 Transcript_97993/m.282661 type:complete len:264 (-) Transcript_97993:376-1167(-)